MSIRAEPLTAAPGDAPARSDTHASRVRQLAVLAVPIALLGVMAWQHRWVTDDAFFDLRVVKQIEAGHGPVFNVGERVEISTSPLWVLILTLSDLVTPLRLEWLSVFLGLALTMSGLALAEAGVMLSQGDGKGTIVPLGALAVAALPAMWDFTTSGLETGLGFAWLGASFFLLARSYDQRRRGRSGSRAPAPWWLPVALGLGVLIRPDFAVFGVAFLLAMFVIAPGRWWPERVKAIGWFSALPLASELFRVGYYGVLVPNTAVAREASRADWSQGWTYFLNFEGTYWLWVPLLGLAVILVAQFTTGASRRDRARVALVVAPVAAALARASGSSGWAATSCMPDSSSPHGSPSCCPSRSWPSGAGGGEPPPWWVSGWSSARQ